MKIYVSNLGFNINEEGLIALFAEQGEVTNAIIARDIKTNKSKGVGYVEMPNEAEAQMTVQRLNGQKLEDRILQLSIVRGREDDSDIKGNADYRGNAGKQNRW
jgi:RNA recognition motif-containing protein